MNRCAATAMTVAYHRSLAQVHTSYFLNESALGVMLTYLTLDIVSQISRSISKETSAQYRSYYLETKSNDLLQTRWAHACAAIVITSGHTTTVFIS